MRRSSAFLAAVAALALAISPGIALARAGGGASFGSRGMRTFSAPPVTRTAPFMAAPIERSVTPQTVPSYAPPLASQPYRSGGFGRGFMGGLLGVGLGSLLFGGFGGYGYGGGLLSLLFWGAILYFGGRWFLRAFAGRQPALAGMGRFARTGASGAMPGFAGGSRPVAVTKADYQAFEQLLYAVQAAWTARDLNRLRQIATPEMAANFGQQLSAQAGQNLHNAVTAVHLDQGDLSEAWIEGGREYATVAMRFSMVDVTRDTTGRVVEGDPSLRTQATELWTFVRVQGGRWTLSAIQQAR
jgi:predicted lipid-binding transport protein (Tim44 family)